MLRVLLMTPRYITQPNTLTARWLVLDTQAGRYCPTLAAGMTRAQAELYAEHLNSRAELSAHREEMEAIS